MNNEIKECPYLLDGIYCKANTSMNANYSQYCRECPNCHYKQLLSEQSKNKKLIEALESVKDNLDNILLPDYEEDYGNYNTFYQQTSAVITQALNEVNK